MTFDEWAEKQGFPVTSTQRPLWEKCWNVAQGEVLRSIFELTILSNGTVAVIVEEEKECLPQAHPKECSH